MKLIFFISFYIIFNNSILANGTKTLEQTLVDDKIHTSFRLMYLHLSYLSYYISKRSSNIMREQINYLKPNQKILKVSEKIYKLLGLKTEINIPYRTSCLDIKTETVSTNLELYKDLNKIEKSIKESLEYIIEIFKIWNEHFSSGLLKYENESNKERNSNIYRLLYNDFLIIFFDVAKSIFDAYEIKYNKVKPEEVYVKDIYIDGLKTLIIKEDNIGLGMEPGIVQLAKRTNEPNIDLIKRMFIDIKTHIKDLPPQIETLIKLFNEYKETFELM